MRIIIENIILFLLPTLFYVGYRIMTRRPGDEASGVLTDAPVMVLMATGTLIVLVVLVAFGSVSGGKPGDIYVPPRLEDGKVIPGHSEKR